MSVLVNLPGGKAVELHTTDARLLVDALWNVSAVHGAVVTIGKIEHRLTAADERELELSGSEVDAVRAAFGTATLSSPTAGLAALRTAIG